MPLIMGLEGFRGRTALAGLSNIGLITPPRATTLAGLYGTFDIIKRHPLLILGALVAGGWWATKKFDHATGSPTTWGEQRLSQSRTRALHGRRRRR